MYHGPDLGSYCNNPSKRGDQSEFDHGWGNKKGEMSLKDNR